MTTIPPPPIMASDPSESVPPQDPDAEVANDSVESSQDPFLQDAGAHASSLSEEQKAASLKLGLAAVQAAAESRGQELMLIDLTEQTAMFDYFLIASGSSRRQLSAMATEIDRVLKTEFHEQKLSVSGFEESRWVVMDYGSLVVHLFDEETREFYDLESLWADAKQVDITELVQAAATQMSKFSGLDEMSR